jgi:hypothetical protein
MNRPDLKWSIGLLVTFVLFMWLFTACTLTGDVKYKTSDRTQPTPDTRINDAIPGGLPNFASFLYYAGLAWGCSSVMECYTPEAA